MKPKDKGFEQAPLVDCIVTIVGKPQGDPCTNWMGIIDIDKLPYRTARYKDKDCVISELVGFLEGLKIQIDEDLEFLRKSLDDITKADYKIKKGKYYECIADYRHAGLLYKKGEIYFASDDNQLFNDGCRDNGKFDLNCFRPFTEKEK